MIHFTQGGQQIGTGTVMDSVIFSSTLSHSLDDPCPRCGDQSRLDGVISSCLDCFLLGGELYLYQYAVNPVFFLTKVWGGTCTLAASDPPGAVLHRASYLLENGFGVYSLFKKNCEDFAIYCKTGKPVFTSISAGNSGQAASFWAAAKAFTPIPLQFLTRSFLGTAAVSCGTYCVSRLVSDVGLRCDIVRVPVETLVARPGSFSEGQASAKTRKTD